jgi:hypothetical protein
MKTNKLSLVRETILPLSSDELSQVAGGAFPDAVRKQLSMGGNLTDEIRTCGPPRPVTGGGTGATTIFGPGPVAGGGVSRAVSGLSNAF